jgi:hypothetical protein
MMRIGDAREILSLFRLATFTTQSYRHLIVCAPFVSDRLLFSKVAPNGAALIPTIVITRPEMARLLSMQIGSRRALALGYIPNLHAKVYIACGKADEDSVALVGSFNMTVAAINENFELGIRLTANTPERSRLIRAIENRLLSMAKFIIWGA